MTMQADLSPSEAPPASLRRFVMLVAVTSLADGARELTPTYMEALARAHRENDARAVLVGPAAGRGRAVALLGEAAREGVRLARRRLPDGPGGSSGRGRAGQQARVEAKGRQLEPGPRPAAVREQRRAAVGAPREGRQAELRLAPVHGAEHPARGLLEGVPRPAHDGVEVERLGGELAQVPELGAKRPRLALERQQPAEREPPPERGGGAGRGQHADDGRGSHHFSKSRCAFT